MSTKRNYMWGWIILVGVLAGAGEDRLRSLKPAL